LKFVKIGSIEQLHVNGKQQKQENSSDIIFSVIQDSKQKKVGLH